MVAVQGSPCAPSSLILTLSYRQACSATAKYCNMVAVQGSPCAPTSLIPTLSYRHACSVTAKYWNMVAVQGSPCAPASLIPTLSYRQACSVTAKYWLRTLKSALQAVFVFKRYQCESWLSAQYATISFAWQIMLRFDDAGRLYLACVDPGFTVPRWSY
jgi:hypothetical protein